MCLAGIFQNKKSALPLRLPTLAKPSRKSLTEKILPLNRTIESKQTHNKTVQTSLQATIAKRVHFEDQDDFRLLLDAVRLQSINDIIDNCLKCWEAPSLKQE